MQKRQYITTAIDYPNAAPHMGHVLEKVLADVIVRYKRMTRDTKQFPDAFDAVRFQIGTDEHGIKIQQTAEKEKLTPRELVDRNVPLFQHLYAKLGISADVFMRTSDESLHWPTVRALWKKIADANMLEKRTYTGLYCSGCERFLTKKDFVDGKCEIHQRLPEEVKEENYFFLLSKETEYLRTLLQSSYKIIPQFRQNETFSLLDLGLEDVSFSRPKSSLQWGIPVPGDEEQTMYVWCDALTNYISGIGFFTDHEERKFWDDAVVTHVIGKDIARFHALIWPAMLKHAGVRPPDQLLIHGFLTSEGQKMSKSLGNVVKPEDVLVHFQGNVDPLRFYLSYEVPVGNDGDFSWKRIDEVYDAKLRNQLGNMLNRVLVMLKKESVALQIPEESMHKAFIAEQWKQYIAAFDSFELHKVLQIVTAFIDTMNASFNDQKPWTLEPAQKIIVLSAFAEQLRHVSLMLLPFIPESAQKMSTQLGVTYVDTMLDHNFSLTETMQAWGGMHDWKAVGEPSILFPPLEKTIVS